MKEKAFTLVELLAVIIILGVLSVLIVPKVINTLNDSEEKTNMASAEGLLKAAEYKYQDNEIKGISENITIDYTTGTNTGLLDFNGKKPEKGQVIIRPNGNIGMFVKIGGNCYSKNYNSSNITVTPYNEETCGQSIKIVTSGDGLYQAQGEEGRLIYRGSNPNNYINIKEDGANDVLYRIISYEPDGTIKVVRNESIGKMEWDEGTVKNNPNIRYNPNEGYYCNCSNGCNVWGNQDNTLYNGRSLGNEFKYGYYMNANDTIITYGTSGKVETDSTLKRYLNDGEWEALANLNKYIDNHEWNVGGVYYSTEDKGILKEKAEEKHLKWTGKVGLLNVTDYVESSNNPDCTSAKSGVLDGYPCKNLNWNYKNIYEWTITPFTITHDAVWYVSKQGQVYAADAENFATDVRPAFYLKSNINLIGEGTESNPYRVDGM